MTNCTKVVLSLFIGLVLSTSVYAQLNVVPSGSTTFTPEELITNVFLGEGVQVTSISYNGAPVQAGYFSNGLADMGIDRGIILSTGDCSMAVGPGSSFASDDADGNFSDPDLDSIIQPNQVMDVVVYDITFIPVSDTLRFRYVFASEEYPEYVCSFNDVFGFFIDGPGISGPYTNNSMNIALVPEPSDPTGLTFTNDPVAIAVVNDQNCSNAPATTYPMYYNDNSNGLNMTYDGYTNVFVAQAIVVPCEEYHIKLVLADAVDHVYDTGVFLEAKSFGTGSILTDLQTVSVDGTIVEGCSGAEIIFGTPNALEDDLELDYSMFGTATYTDDYILSQNGVTFTPGDPLTIQAGDTTVSIFAQALEDNIDEFGEFIAISVQKDVCTQDTLYIPIKDNLLVNPQLSPDTSMCTSGSGNTMQLNGELNITLPDPPKFTYTGNDLISNDVLPVNSSLQVLGVYPAFLQEGTIRNVCVKLDHLWDSDIDMLLFSPNNTPMLLSSDNGQNSQGMDVCFVPDGAASVTTILDTLQLLFPPNGNVTDTALYFTGEYTPEGIFSDFWSGGAQSPTNGTWRLLIADDSGSNWGDFSTGTLNEWSITFEPIFKLNYVWDPTTDLSCLDCPDPTLTLPDQTTTYHLTVYDTYGCSVEDSITVFVQDSLDAPEIDCIVIAKDSIVFGWNTVVGATGYQVNIDGAGWIDVGTDLTYTVNNLAVDQTVQIEVQAIGNCPAKIGVHECTTLDCDQPTYDIAITNATCNGNSNGEISITNANNIYNGFTFAIGVDTNSTGIFSGLTAGDYTVVLIDALGCTYPLDTLITQPDSLIAIPEELQMVNCFGDATGSGQINVTGGNYPYTFSLNGGTDSIATGLAASSYLYTVTDANGCIQGGDLVITENTAINFETFGVDLTCFGSDDGQITVFNITGGVPGYSFLWDDANNQTTIQAAGLEVGSYAVTVTDTLGCTATATDIILTSPTQITGPFTKVDAVCGGALGSAIITPTGGTAPYGYEWSDTGADTDSRNDLAADTYYVTITDFNGCSIIDTIQIDAPSDMVLTMSRANVDCNGNNTGQTSVSVTGGTPPYSYLWNDPLAQTLKTAVNLPAGLFKVAVTDAQSCVQSDTISVFQPEELTVDTTLQHIACFGGTTGSITTTVTGGTLPYTYTYTLPDGSTVNTPNLTDIPAGTYNLTVIDANNCQVDLVITITEPAPVVLTFATPDTICFGASNGTAEVNVTGGTAPYQYAWSDISQTAKHVTNLIPGSYTVSVTDDQGCVYNSTTSVQEHSEISAVLDQSAALCHDESNGVATVQDVLHGGSSNSLTAHNYEWNTAPVQTTLSAHNLTGGESYTVTIQDAATGCTATASIEIDNPDVVTPVVSNIQGVTCSGFTDGSAQVSAMGGTPSYSYQWDASANNQVGDLATNLPKGNFMVTVTDANGCIDSMTIEIDEPNPIVMSLDSTDIRCSGESTGSITSETSGGILPYHYLWSNGDTTATLSNIPAGVYTITLTDDRNCTDTQSIEVTEPGAPLVATLNTEDITCYAGRNGQILLESVGGTAPYEYSLNGGEFSAIPNLIGLNAGTYEVIVKDARECMTTLSGIELRQPDAIVLDLGPDLVISFGDTVLLTPAIDFAIGDISYAWTTSSGFSLNCFDCPTPYAFPGFQEYVYLAITDENGCTASDEQLIQVRKETKIYVPTGFSPNGDGNNDILFVMGQKDVVIESFSIFDRWGEKVYTIEDFDINTENKGWTGEFRGKPMPIGQYAWQLKATMPDGHTEFLQGMSTLVR